MSSREHDTPATGRASPLVDPERFREVVGHFGSGVTVVTTRDGTTDYGTTASSVASLSLQPPMMVVCLNEESATGQAVHDSGIFVINVLSRPQTDLARRFAVKGGDKFSTVGYERGQLGAPLLSGALAHIECQVTARVAGGSHTVLLGEVQNAVALEGDPLVYYRGSFGGFALAGGDALSPGAPR